MKIQTKSWVLLFALVSAALGLVGCGGYYSAYPGYGPYYGGYGGGPYYGRGSVVVAVGDRPYYRGAGYWSGNRYYAWKPGHWVWRNGQKVWIRGHYVMRRY